jgi:uncharacterized membrane protein YidH (DUF202 family)
MGLHQLAEARTLMAWQRGGSAALETAVARDRTPPLGLEDLYRPY